MPAYSLGDDPLIDPLDAFFPVDTAAPEPLGQAAVAALCERVAAAGGLVGVEDLVSAGTAPALIAAALTKPSDKRRASPLLALTVTGQRLVKLSAAGWETAGYPNKRTGASSLSEGRLRHTLAPGQLCRWLDSVPGRLGAQAGDLLVSATTSADAFDAYRERVIQASWELIHTQAVNGQPTFTQAGSVPRPDALVLEEWSGTGNWRPSVAWPSLAVARKREDEAAGRPVVLRVGIEVETTAKSSLDLSAKVHHLDSVMVLGALDAVVWVVDDAAIAARLARFGVGAPPPGGDDVRHYFAAASRCAVTSEGLLALPQNRAVWWPSHLAAATS